MKSIQDTIKDLQSQVRELEIANVGLRARLNATRGYIMELEELAASTRDNAADDFLQAAADSVLTRAKAEGNMVTGQPGSHAEEYICPTCSSTGWKANCNNCIPY